MEVPQSVVLVGEHQLTRHGIRTVLGLNDNFQVVAEAWGEDQAIEACREHMPDMVVMDMASGRCGGARFLQRVSESCNPCRTLALIRRCSTKRVFAVLNAGVDGYLPADSSEDRFMEAMDTVAGGEAFYPLNEVRQDLSPACRRMIIKEEPDKCLGGLTRRERQVFQMVGLGYTNKAISAELGVNIKTVEKHRANFMAKLELARAVEVRLLYKVFSCGVVCDLCR